MLGPGKLYIRVTFRGIGHRHFFNQPPSNNIEYLELIIVNGDKKKQGRQQRRRRPIAAITDNNDDDDDDNWQQADYGGES